MVTLAGKSDQIARQRETTERANTYGKDVSFLYEHQDTLYEKHLVAKAADRNVPEDEIIFNSDVVQIRDGFGSAVVGAVKASELARLHTKHGNRLFEGNVRLFIGERKGGINEKIIETASSRPGDFWALNNGITIVANNFEEITPKKFKIFQFSIVNGCQSTVSLSRAVHHDRGAERCQILVRVVGAKKALLTDIVRYNNTQNPVKLSAVRLLDPIQEGLRTAFSRIDIQYAPKQEGAKATKSHKRIELDRIAQYLASTSEDTILEAVTKKAELFDRSYKSIFPRGLRPEIVYLAWILAHHIEAERANLLEDTSISGDPQMKAILGIYGTPWGKIKKNLGLRVAKGSAWRLPKLHQVS